LGMLISREGIPMGYELFEGNRFEGKTVGKILRKLKEVYSIEKVIFVGDKGILSKGVLEEIERRGYEYIVSAKVRSVGKRYEEEIKEMSKYKRLNEDIMYREIEVGGKRLISCYSKSRAERDRHMREELIEKLRERAKRGEVIKPAYRKYLKRLGGKIEIDEEKIRKQASWDGYFGFYTNSSELRAEEVIERYKELWKIEASFRSLKSTLRIRPIYHWTARRIEGHVMMSYLSFYVLRVMEMSVKGKGIDMSEEEILREIKKVRAVEIKSGDEKYIVRTKIEGKLNHLFRALGVKIPPVILSKLPVVE